MDNAEEKLPEAEGETSKSGIGIAHYVSKKSDLQFAVKECRREVVAPTRRAQARLKSVAPYLVIHWRLVI